MTATLRGDYYVVRGPGVAALATAAGYTVQRDARGEYFGVPAHAWAAFTRGHDVAVVAVEVRVDYRGLAV